MACLLSLLVVTYLICLSVEAWHSTVQFNATIDATSPHQPQFKLFQTAFKSEDFFALISSDRNNHLERNATTITIGARDYLYQLSLPDLNIVNVSKSLVYVKSWYLKIQIDWDEFYKNKNRNLFCKIICGICKTSEIYFVAFLGASFLRQTLRLLEST